MYGVRGTASVIIMYSVQYTTSTVSAEILTKFTIK